MVKKKSTEEDQGRNPIVWVILLVASIVINVLLGSTLMMYMIAPSTASGSSRFESGVSRMQAACGDPTERQKLYFGEDQYDATGQKMTRALIDYECEWISSDTSSVFHDGYNNYLKAHDLPPAEDLGKYLKK